MRPITVVMISYKRSLFLAESVKAIYRDPGIDFDFILHDNSENNLGAGVLHDILPRVNSKYFVQVEDDMIWLSPKWLLNLVKGIEQKPDITQEGKDLGFKDEWGFIATNGLIDDVNNSGMWPDRFESMIEYKINDIWYWANMRPFGGASISHTKVLKELDVFPKKTKHLNKNHYHQVITIENSKYQMAYIRDTYVYHAASPYWNKLYPEVWEEKHRTTPQTIEEGLKIFNDKGDFNFSNKEPMDFFIGGKFNEYATRLYNRSNGLI